jgi:hypothetical protein
MEDTLFYAGMTGIAIFFFLSVAAQLYTNQTLFTIGAGGTISSCIFIVLSFVTEG